MGLNHFDLATAIPTAADTQDSPLFTNATAEQTLLLYTKTEILAILGNQPTGFMNRTTWVPQLLPLTSLARSHWNNHQLVPFIRSSPAAPAWVDIVLNNLDETYHPFHLHGHDFYVLASYRSQHGWGSYSPYAAPGTSAAVEPVLNLQNPLRKDTVIVPRRGYVVLRFRADSPGIWMLHCHVLFHQGSGMAMGLHVGEEEAHDAVDANAAGLCVRTG